MKNHNMRSAFSMITAIFVIVLMASVGAFIMNLSGKMVEETSVQYRHEQAILYAKSYTELAIMAATTEPCVRRITADVDGTAAQVRQGLGYRVVVDVQYIGDNTPANCPNELGGAIMHPPSIGNIILVDTYVQYRNPDSAAAIAGSNWSTQFPGITYHRRTLQRL